MLSLTISIFEYYYHNMIISNTINLDSVNGKIDLTNIKSLFSAESYGLVCQMLTDIEAHCLMMEPEPGIEKISRLKGLDAEKWAKSYLSKIYPLYSPLVSTLMLTIIEELNWIFSSEKKKELKIATGLAE